MSEAAVIAEEARKLIRIIEEGNKAYAPHTLTFGQIVGLVHLVARLADEVAALEDRRKVSTGRWLEF